MRLRSMGAWAGMMLVLGAATPAGAELALQDTDRVVLFGDTAFGSTHLTQWLDEFLRLKYPQLHTEVCSLGMAGRESADLLGRLEREVLPIKPTLVVVCFGLEHGQRKAFEQGLLDEYITQMGVMIDKVEAAGARVLLVTPPVAEEARFRGLAAANYAAVVDQYAAALLKLAQERKLAIIDWHAALARFNPAGGEARHGLTDDGLLPTALSIAVFNDLLLTQWGAEPLACTIKLDWRNPGQVEGNCGQAQATAAGTDLVTLKLIDAPVPLVTTPPAGLAPEQWPMTRWSEYRLQVTNAPSNGLMASLPESKGIKHAGPEEWARGVNLGLGGPLAEHAATQAFLNAIRTKDLQFGSYRSFCDQKLPEPELAEGYRLYAEALRELARATQKIMLRQPRVLTADLELRSGTLPPAATQPKAVPGGVPRPRKK